ncbi:heat shock factor 2-binding protein isoform X2 [Archocentrus centrarchus]|uniref:heat shock factor 2-binding protein isoform X2 n=1 Tax=Archocentrus centrarchus TaxID=63155 RepID=UPI0011E9B654|nr:heat shock factor 2-binding protein isoform X2 [Archocentrus centrarchus]
MRLPQLPSGLLSNKEAAVTDGFVRVTQRDLQRLTTEVMQLQDFLPRVLNADLIEMVHRGRTAQTVKEHIVKEQEQMQQECLHLQSRLDAVQAECQTEKEEKLLLREQLQQQADFCSDLGSAACGLLWSCSVKEDTVLLWLADGKLQAFLAVAAQTLESFVKSLDEDMTTQTDDHNSHELQFVLAVAGTITNIAAVTKGRDFLSSSAHVLLDTLMKLLKLMKPGIFPRLKVLMLMTLYNVSISLQGLKYLSENQGLIPLIWTLLDDGQWEVCLHALRLLQSLLLEDDVLLRLGPSLLDPGLHDRVSRLADSVQPGLRLIALQTLKDLQALQQGRACEQSGV